MIRLESDTSVHSEVTGVPDVEVCTLCTLQNTLETAKDVPTEGPERSPPASVEEFKSWGQRFVCFKICRRGQNVKNLDTIKRRSWYVANIIKY